MNKLAAARPLFRSLISPRVVAPITRLEHHYRDPLERPPSYNDLPQPEGDWTDAYQKKQFKYNSILGASVAFLVGTIIFVKESEIIFFNFFPPDTYE